MEKSNIYEKLRLLHKAGIDGRGETVAIIDTGIRPHLDFCAPRNRVHFVDIFAGEAASEKYAPYDDNGHGTAVAGIMCGNGLVSGKTIVGVAPKARIIAIKAVSKNGNGSTLDIVEAMRWVQKNYEKERIKTLNLSFGSEPIVGVDPLCLAAEMLWKSGITVVCSAGNSGPAYMTIKSPAISPYVITVGGAKIEDDKWSAAEFSSRGPYGQFPKPDILAPAEDVMTTSLAENYSKYSGTSMASPFVAGLACLISGKKPEYAPDKIKELILENATKKGECDVNSCGYGLVSLDFLFDL